jgi:hypothetical protein
LRTDIFALNWPVASVSSRGGRSQRSHAPVSEPASTALSIHCSALNTYWRCSAGRSRTALLEPASTGSRTDNIGFDIHKKTISFCAKAQDGTVFGEGTIGKINGAAFRNPS